MKIVVKKIEKNHNVSQESDLSIFLRYLGFFISMLLGLYLFFILLGQLVVTFVSLEDEEGFFNISDTELMGEIKEIPLALRQRYSDLPYSLHLIESNEQNAFAALGPHLYLTSSFLENIDSYEALDFIIGHEAGHLAHRDVLRRIITEFPLSIILTLMGIGGEQGVIHMAVSNGFSKYQETKADIYALDYLYQKNGHVGCAFDFFSDHNSMINNISEIFSTHPMTSKRINRIQLYAEKKGYQSKQCTPFSFSSYE